MRADDHPRNAERLSALASYGITDTPRRRAFDDITAFVGRICEMPIAVISLVESHRQWFLSEVGLQTRSTPIGASVCAHAILDGDFFEVPDLRADQRFADNPLVTGDPRLRFYAGTPLLAPNGLPMGMLCVMDFAERETTAQQRRVLRVLARRVMCEIELLRVAREEQQVAEQLAIAVGRRRETLQYITERLRAPLNTIGLSATLMGDSLSRAERGPFAAGLSAAAEQMSTLVEDLLARAVTERQG